MLAERRKVCILSNNPDEFQFLDEEFNRVYNVREADFIICDFCHPIPDLTDTLFDMKRYLKDRVRITSLSSAPLIFTAISGQIDSKAQTVCNYLRENRNFSPPVCGTPAELLSILNYFHFILPETKPLEETLELLNSSGKSAYGTIQMIALSALGEKENGNLSHPCNS